jgi:hypothetical protein
MRWIVAIFGVPVVLGLIAISVVMNFRFGMLLGRSENDGLVYALASACADILKCLLPIVLAWSWQRGRYLVMFAGSILFLIFTAYSVASSLGYAAINRAERSGHLAAEMSRHRDLRSELDQKAAQRAGLPAFRPSAALEAEMLALRQHARWVATSECATATLTESRTFCDSYFRLKAEHATAEAADRLDREVSQLRQTLAASGEAAPGTSADPQLEVIANILSLGEDKAKLALTILLSALVECGSGLGFMVVLAMWNDPGADRQLTPSPILEPSVALSPVTTPVERSSLLLSPPVPAPLTLEVEDTSSVAAWAEARLVKAPRLKAFAATLYADYIKWSQNAGLSHLVSWTPFLRHLREAGYSENSTGGGRILYPGVGLNKKSKEP